MADETENKRWGVKHKNIPSSASQSVSAQNVGETSILKESKLTVRTVFKCFRR